ncbi:hypothetical protein GS464_29705 [Rhodococcus hoagii]|nr:hypothetical protein [Prescottella equi]
MERGNFEEGSLDEHGLLRREAVQEFVSRCAIHRAFEDAMQAEEAGVLDRPEAIRQVKAAPPAHHGDERMSERLHIDLSLPPQEDCDDQLEIGDTRAFLSYKTPGTYGHLVAVRFKPLNVSSPGRRDVGGLSARLPSVRITGVL